MRRAADGFESEHGDTLEHVGQLEVLDDLGVQFGDDEVAELISVESIAAALARHGAKA